MPDGESIAGCVGTARELCLRASEGLWRELGVRAEALGIAPGRVNLIGDHTDYCGGLVMPMAIDRWTVIAGAKRKDDLVRVGTALTGEIVTLGTGAGEPGWARYVRGVIELCGATGLEAGGLDLWIESSVPGGSGLSSSAALCVAVATLIETLADRRLGVMAKAELCQRAEHVYAGVPCGIMDQAVVAGAVAGSAMLLNCGTLAWEPVAIDERAVAVLVADTGVSRRLADGVYAARRRSCEEAAQRLGVRSLSELEKAPAGGDEAMRCARHVVTENSRVRLLAEAARGGDWKLAGEQMNASHASLRDDFRVTGEALDAMVEIAQGLSGVLGARMTGAGMGGCAVVLAERAAAGSVARELEAKYRERTGREGAVFPVRAVGGASGARISP